MEWTPQDHKHVYTVYNKDIHELHVWPSRGQRFIVNTSLAVHPIMDNTQRALQIIM